MADRHVEPKEEHLRLRVFSLPVVPCIVHRQKDTEIFLKDSAGCRVWISQNISVILITAEVCERKQWYQTQRLIAFLGKAKGVFTKAK